MKNKGYFLTIWEYIWTCYIKNSVIYSVLSGLYSFLSEKWQSSLITTLFCREASPKIPVSKTVIGKICFSPFRLIEWLNKKYGSQITAQKDNSWLIRSCKYYLHNLLALNMRFIGVLLGSQSVVSLILSLIMGGGIKLEVVGIIISAVLIFFDVNLTDYFKDSVVVKFFEAALGTSFSFDFYYITKCSGIKSIVCAAVFGCVAGAISGITSPIFSILFLGGLWFFFMVLYKVEFGVFATLFLAPLVPTMALIGLTLLCFFSLIIKALTTKRFEFKTDGMELLLILLLCIYLLSAITSFATFKSLQIWAVYFAFMTFYFVVVNTIKSKKQLMDLLTVFCLSGFLVCLYGILQYIFDWNVSQAWMDEEMFEDIKMRIYSTLENPNVLGEYILLVLPIAISLMWKKPRPFAKLVYGSVSVIMGIALILTFSRGCWIGIIASAAIFITFAAGKLWGLAILALPLIPMILPESIIKRFTSIGNMKDSSTSYRVYIWMGTLLMLKDFWLSGIGPGTESFTQVYPFYSYSSIVAPHSHNLFLQIIVESGILGLGAFLLILIAFIRRLSSAHRLQGKLGEMSVMVVGIGAATIGFLVQGLFDNCFYNYRVFMIFWSQLALGISAAGIIKAEASNMEVKNND